MAEPCVQESTHLPQPLPYSISSISACGLNTKAPGTWTIAYQVMLGICICSWSAGPSTWQFCPLGHWVC